MLSRRGKIQDSGCMQGIFRKPPTPGCVVFSLRAMKTSLSSTSMSASTPLSRSRWSSGGYPPFDTLKLGLVQAWATLASRDDSETITGLWRRHRTRYSTACSVSCHHRGPSCVPDYPHSCSLHDQTSAIRSNFYRSNRFQSWKQRTIRNSHRGFNTSPPPSNRSAGSWDLWFK
ncbi:hypothetical protein BD311DRAFT_167319 [Dichomitus squalens]|uniref:Uncharacterized protein n=1 Tax=Dichomitus squalens TaxID=114155 RepID=A0A4Q9M6X6_9APHY|nr:hypothetical protein BD311DRAFT_167319 [Dichomitus squalens]